jgi:hypothetical protein
MTTFAHDSKASTTTLSEIMRVRGIVSPDEFFGCFAYATQSGFRAFELRAGQEFWTQTRSRWLFGIDYGRTAPRALREIAGRTNAEVRVFDGSFIVKSAGFLPRRDFHPKIALMESTVSGAQGIVLGSGNFSRNGLERSVEAGSSVVATTKSKVSTHIHPVRSVFEEFWTKSCPLDSIIDEYELRLSELIKVRDDQRPAKPTNLASGFWIEAGYVTKNRGSDKPGNQIFAPSGFHRFFGFNNAGSGSTLIDRITFKTSVGPNVTKNLRNNDNGMEKLTLPMPEAHGFGVYDGKILVFEPRGNQFFLNALEASDFESVFGHRVIDVKVMTGGRRFGAFI